MSRHEAQALLLAGDVTLPGVAAASALKPGHLVDAAADVAVAPRRRYAGRGAEKLLAALDAFAVDPTDRACLDAGASTGGFTDLLLQRGARIVYAVDVGRGQLAERLRHDPRVVSMERTNLRTLEHLPEPISLATLDLSFISLRLVLRTVRSLVAGAGQVIALVKPQFEAGREAVPRGGVVRDPAVHRAVLERFAVDAAAAGFAPAGLIRSPLTGARGNVEFFALLASPDVAPSAWNTALDLALPI